MFLCFVFTELGYKSHLSSEYVYRLVFEHKTVLGALISLLHCLGCKLPCVHYRFKRKVTLNYIYQKQVIIWTFIFLRTNEICCCKWSNCWYRRMFQPHLQICLATCHIITCYEHLDQGPWKSFPCSIAWRTQWRMSPNKSSHWSKAHQESICCWERGRNLTGRCSSVLCTGLMR